MNDLMMRYVVESKDGEKEIFTGEFAEQDAQFFASKNDGEITCEIYREQTPAKVERTEKVEARSGVSEPVGYQDRRDAAKTKVAPFSSDSEPAKAPHEKYFGEQLPGGTEVVDPAQIQAEQKEKEILDPPRAVEE